MTHAVKTWGEFFKLQENNEKLFELRKDDRPYKVGDTFLSQEFDPAQNKYSGKELKFRIVYILRDAAKFGLKAGYCILQLKEIED